MANAIANVFKDQLLKGNHNFQSGGDTYKIALYTSSRTAAATDTVYNTTNESSGTNYTAKGASLTRVDPTTSGTTAFTDFSDLTFSNVTLTAAGALIFNDSASGDPSVCVLNFGADKSASSGDFTVVFPAAAASTAIIRIA